MSNRYKLVYAPFSDPWLYDLKKDPDEIINFISEAKYREKIRELSKDLLDYGKKYNDEYIKIARIKADMDWAINGQGPYKRPEEFENKKAQLKQKKRKKK